MRVYIVQQKDDYDAPGGIEGVFASKAKANEAADALNHAMWESYKRRELDWLNAARNQGSLSEDPEWVTYMTNEVNVSFEEWLKGVPKTKGSTGRPSAASTYYVWSTEVIE